MVVVNVDRTNGVSVSSFSVDFFYKIPRSFVFANTSIFYRRFLRKSGLVDLTDCEYFGFGKTLLRADDNIDNIANNLGIDYRNNGRIVKINQDDSRKLVKELDKDSFLVPVGLMYKVIIPYLKSLEEHNPSEVKNTLHEMRNYAGWLEDMVLNKTNLVVANKNKKLTFFHENGYFDKKDFNIYGYPKKLRKDGEFIYWAPIQDEVGLVAGFFKFGAGTRLFYFRDPKFLYSNLGMHVAKVFRKSK